MQGNTSALYDILTQMPSLQQLSIVGPVRLTGGIDAVSSSGGSMCTLGVRHKIKTALLCHRCCQNGRCNGCTSACLLML